MTHRGHIAWVQILALLLPTCMTLAHVLGTVMVLGCKRTKRGDVIKVRPVGMAQFTLVVS